MAWVAIDSTAPDSSDTTKTKGGKWVPIASAPARQGPATAGQIAKQAGQNIAVQGAGIAPIVAGRNSAGRSQVHSLQSAQLWERASARWRGRLLATTWVN